VRITIVQGPFLPVPPLLGGAVERSMQTLGRHWATAGCSVTHISRRFPGLAEEETVDGVHHRRLLGNLLGLSSHWSPSDQSRFFFCFFFSLSFFFLFSFSTSFFLSFLFLSFFFLSFSFHFPLSFS
jgi:hypothetical protein